MPPRRRLLSKWGCKSQPLTNAPCCLQELIPYMVRHQHRPPTMPLETHESSEGLEASSSNGTGRSVSSATALATSAAFPEAMIDLFRASNPPRTGSWLCQAFLAPSDSLCIRADTIESYADACRCVQALQAKSVMQLQPDLPLPPGSLAVDQVGWEHVRFASGPVLGDGVPMPHQTI